MTWLEKPHTPLTGSLAPDPAPAWGSLVPLDLPLNPVQVFLDVGEDGRQIYRGATNAPTDHALLNPGASLPAHQGAPGVSLWGERTITGHVKGQGAQPQQTRARRRPLGQDWPTHLTMPSGMILLLALMCRYLP